MVFKLTFPIKTATACQLKWTWSTLYLNDGTTSSCHRVGRHAVSLDNFDSFHNTPEKIEQRQTMLKGEWPQPLSYMKMDEGCRYCQKIEAAGGQSDRQFHLQIPNLAPKELEIDPTAVEVTPKILEVFLSNTCNLSCTYCNAKNSSQIERENKRFGDNSLVIDKDLTKKYTEKFFEWLAKNANELHRLHLLGGEPLYQKEFYRCLDFFESNPNNKLEFNIVTNLMIDSTKLEQLISRWRMMIAKKKIKRIDITVSIDCWDDEQEYARWGIKLKTIENNINLLLKEKWLFLNINSTLTPLTIRKFHVLVDKINDWKTQHTVNHHFQTVFSPSYHNPDIFGTDFWKDDIELALSKMPQTNWQEQNSYRYLNGILSQIQCSTIKYDEINLLILHLDELDRRRNTNWRELFPYLLIN